MHQNIASILKKKDEFEIVLANLKKENKDINVICLSETFIKKGHESNLTLSDYKIGSMYTRENEKRGGTCILLKNNISFTKLQIAESLSEDYNFECSGVVIKEPKMIVVCIYRTPTSNITIFFEKLEILLKKICNQSTRKIVLSGDWNIDILKTNGIAQNLQSLLQNYNMYLHITTPTRKKACIDLIVSNIENANGFTKQLLLSDHNTCQIMSFHAHKYKNIQHWFELKRDFSMDNRRKFGEGINALTFNDVLQCKDTNLAFNLFHDTLTLLFDLCFPIIKIKLCNRTKQSKWITKGLRRSCAKKRALYYKYINSNSQNKIKNKKTYKSYNKLLQRCMTTAHKICNSKTILTSKNKCKASWTVVNKNIDKKTIGNDIEYIKKNNDIIYNSHDIAETFNDYFLTIGHPTTNDKIDNTNKYNINNSIYISPTSEEEIQRIIMNLRNTNSVGYDNINTDILKLCAYKLATPLSHIINLSFEKGVFPERLKFSKVKPLFKKGDEADMGNYRPITLIPVISKIFEKAMAKRVNSFIAHHKIIKREQYGFQEGKSTSLACFSLVKYVTEALNNKHLTLALFLDMSKAFDSVSHKILLKKLFDYGIRGVALDWFESYLCNRQQCTEITRIENNVKVTSRSNYKTVEAGVPQGSILGPLLFIIYINDLPDTVKRECILFADDCTLVFQNKNSENLQADVHSTLYNTIDWLNKNNLKININKTKAIQFHTYKGKKLNLNLEYNQNKIDIVKSTTFLGLILDEHCNWKEHIDHVCKKVNRFVYALNRIKRVTSINIALQSYHGYVASVLRYGIIIWGNSVDFERAFKAQKKCIRVLAGINNRESCKPFFIKFKILTLPCIYISELCLLVKQHPEYFKINDTNNKSTRDSRKNRLCIPPSNLTLFSKNAYSMAVRLFNKLPSNLKNVPKIKFKNMLLHWLSERNFYSVKEYLEFK